MLCGGYDRPIFISRVLNNEFKYIDNFLRFDGVITDANIANHYSKPWSKVLEKQRKGEIDLILIDPNTAKLEYKACVQKMTYQKLNYCPEVDPLNPDDFSDPEFSSQFATNVINTQTDLGANVLLTPYFVAKSVKSPWYEVNINLAQKSIDTKNNLGISEKLLATICISISNSIIEENHNKLIYDYKNLDVDGYYILAEGFSDRTSSVNELVALLKLVKDLEESGKPVIIGSIDAFGVIANGFGSAGFSAGICWLDSYNEQNFVLDLSGGRSEDAMRERFIYIPEVFMKFPRDRAQLIYSNIDKLDSHSDSLYYHDKSINWNDRARYYFLEQRYKELEKLGGLSKDDMLIDLENRLNEAIILADKIFSEDIQIQRSHLARWKEAVELTKSESFFII